jgi:hypothetical protein
MSIDTAITMVAFAIPFLIFASVLAWADHQTHKLERR